MQRAKMQAALCNRHVQKVAKRHPERSRQNKMHSEQQDQRYARPDIQRGKNGKARSKDDGTMSVAEAQTSVVRVRGPVTQRRIERLRKRDRGPIEPFDRRERRCRAPGR